jgi:hypothetical protein
MKFYELPKELIIKIYEYDNTYHIIYKNNVRYLKNVFKVTNNFIKAHNLNENSVYSYKNLYKFNRTNFRYMY